MATRLDDLLFSLRRLGRVGAAGTVLAVAAVLFGIFALRPADQQRAALAARNALAEQTASVQAATGYRTLAETPDDTLRLMFSAAREAGLELDQGDYQLVLDQQGEGYARYQLTVPVQGPYPAIRDFMAHLLNADPALALASVRIGREAIEADEVDASLRFVLYLRGRQ